MAQHVRVVALAIIRRPERDEILVFEGKDRGRDLVYHRPLGGGIEFGETGEVALRREFLEEIGVSILVRDLLGVFECVFEYDGVPKHEVQLVYECAFEDAALYGRSRFRDLEGNGYDAIWRQIEDPVTLFPEGLGALLSGRPS